MKTSALPLSILDLCPVTLGSTPRDALRNSLDLARAAEQMGYHRFWVAEHHNMVGIASAATSVVIGYLAAGTERIRIGSGGIMLPNHSPLQIAEQFGTLESLYPGRIDLGLGRAPGTDMLTARALRRGRTDGEDFPQMLEELRHYFAEPEPGQRLVAVPGAGLDIPIWLLGSSTFSAQLAASLGLPFAFAGQFSPDYMLAAMQGYRETFQPSDKLQQPLAMLGINAFVAETRDEAHYLATSHQQSFLNMIRGERGLLRPPVENMDELWLAHERHQVLSTLAGTLIGDEQTVAQQIADLRERYGMDELIVNSPIFDQEKRRDSYRRLMRAAARL